jgi:serine/threonine-protein kinase
VELEGFTLEQLVKADGPLAPGRTIFLLRQVCRALREAHAVGLIHRDIKPSNIIVCERGGVGDVAKLLDFGLVRTSTTGAEEASLTQEGAITGTPAYMSPEQATAKEGVDARSDIYSMGALAYFLLTGRPPFAGRSPVQVLAAHLYEQPAPPTGPRGDVGTELQNAVLRCLAKDPAERFPDAESLERVLARCLTGASWTEEEATRWWRSRSTRNGNKGTERMDEGPGRTNRCS